MAVLIAGSCEYHTTEQRHYKEQKQNSQKQNSRQQEKKKNFERYNLKQCTDGFAVPKECIVCQHVVY